MQWIPKAAVLAQGLCLASLELDPCLGACVVALPAGTLLCRCSPATWMLGACAAGGKTALRGALVLLCTLRPMQWVPKCYTWQHLGTGLWQKRLRVLPQKGACSDPGAETHIPSTPDVKRMSPACAAKPNSVHETCPERVAHSHPRREEGAGLCAGFCPVLPVPLCCISFLSPGLLGDSHCSPLTWVTSDKPGCRRKSSSPAAGRGLCSSCLWLLGPVLAQLPLSWMFLLSLLAARPLFLPRH